MCGISGEYIWGCFTNISAELSRMNDSITHRGPDGEGYWVHDRGFIGFGHRRLSILDLSERGKQPMSYADGRYHITYNGEVFNFIEIREQLGQYGYKFWSDTDTEVILAAYDFWGKDCLQHFNGMWAFAIWDEKEQELFLSRDHFGIKPLYYLYQPGRRFVFGSETVQFKHLEGYNRQFDDTQLLACIRNPHHQEGAGITIYEGIKSILPGHYMVVKDGVMHHKRWWCTMSFNLDVPEKYSEQVKEFQSLFFDSCRLRLRSDVPIASALSGGLDSSSVYSSLYHLNKLDLDKQLTRIPSEWQKAFVATFPGTIQDETEYARKVVDHVGGTAFYWEQLPGVLERDLVDYTKRFDAVYATPIHVIAKVYEEMRHQGIVVSMDGHGVDEMMYGYAGLQLDAARYAYQSNDEDYAILLIDTYVNLFPQERQREAEEYAQKVVYGTKVIDTRMNLSGWKVMASRIKMKFFPPVNWLSGSTAERLPFVWPKDSIFDAPCERELYKQFHYSPLPTILRNFDKASMMSGVEIRMPFMDHRLVAFVFQLPLKSKLGNGYTKRILRDAMTGILPEQVRTRTTKIGFSAPIREWFDGPLKNYLLDTVHSRSFRGSHLWNGKVISRDIEFYYKSGKYINFNMLWNIINTHILTQHNVND